MAAFEGKKPVSETVMEREAPTQDVYVTGSSYHAHTHTHTQAHTLATFNLALSGFFITQDLRHEFGTAKPVTINTYLRSDCIPASEN